MTAMIGAVAYLPALIIAGAALLVLLSMLSALLVAVRRFRAEFAAFWARLDAETSILQAGGNELRGRLDQIRGRAD